MELRLHSSEDRMTQDRSSNTSASVPSVDSSTVPRDATPDFQSSFARSLFIHNNQCPPLDIDLNHPIEAKVDETLAPDVFQPGSTTDPGEEPFWHDTSLNGQHFNPLPPLLASSPSEALADEHIYGSHSLQLHDLTDNSQADGHGLADQQMPSTKPKNGRIYQPSTTSKRRYMNNNRSQMPDAQNKPISSDIEVLRLRKECQGLIEENRRLMSTADHSIGDAGTAHQRHHLMGSTRSLGASSEHSSTNVESVVLQTQVETLQWQLKQVESSRQMYHAVMEEVVRFLERCYQSIGHQEQSTEARIARSKSVNHVFVPHNFNPPLLDLDVVVSPAKGRHRTSTRITADKPAISTAHRMNCLDEHLDTSAISLESNSNCTWRRASKVTSSDNPKTDSSKLSSEAFRLMRTVQSLLNLREPVLSETTPMPPTSTTTHSVSIDQLPSSPNYILNPNPVMAQSMGPMHRQALNRDSRLSMQSSTDDSVHSTSSSYHETEDEESPTHVFCPRRDGLSSSASAGNNQTNRRSFLHFRTSAGGTISSADEESSGFSSMNSFQEIGLPNIPAPHYTPMHPRSRLSTTSTISLSDQSRCSANNHNETETNSTDDPFAVNKMRNIQHSSMSGRMSLPVSNRRWSSAPPIPPRTLSTFRTTDEPMKVLWV